MLAVAHHLADTLPEWLQEPAWWRPLTHAVRAFLQQHQSSALFIVIFPEELGVPLTAPGDVAIAYGGYLTRPERSLIRLLTLRSFRAQSWAVHAT